MLQYYSNIKFITFQVLKLCHDQISHVDKTDYLWPGHLCMLQMMAIAWLLVFTYVTCALLDIYMLFDIASSLQYCTYYNAVSQR